MWFTHMSSGVQCRRTFTLPDPSFLLASTCTETVKYIQINYYILDYICLLAVILLTSSWLHYHHMHTKNLVSSLNMKTTRLYVALNLTNTL